MKIDKLPRVKPPTTEEEIMNFMRWCINNDRIIINGYPDKPEINCTEDMAEALLIEYLIGDPNDCKEAKS